MKKIKLTLTLFSCLIVATNFFSQTINTIAGTGIRGNTGDGGLALNANIDLLTGYASQASLAVDKWGNKYFAQPEYGVIRRIDAKTGIIERFAGVPHPVSPFPATPPASNTDPLTAVLKHPTAVSVDDNGDVYFSDDEWHIIYKIAICTTAPTTPIGSPLSGFCNKLYKVAGTGVAGFSGNGGLAINAQINYPGQIIFDHSNNLLFIDGDFNGVIRKINSAGIISSINTTNPNQFDFEYGGGYIAVDLQDNIYVTENHPFHLYKVDNFSNATTILATSILPPNTSFGTGDGGLLSMATFACIQQVQFDNAGNMYILECLSNINFDINSKIRKVAKITQIIETVAGKGTNYLDEGITNFGMPFTGSFIMTDCGNILVGWFQSPSSIQYVKSVIREINFNSVGEILHAASNALYPNTSVLKNTKIKKTTINISNGVQQSFLTEEGIYNWSPPNTLGGNYTITPTKNNNVRKNNGVSSIDMVLTTRHILGLKKFDNPYICIAGDVNNNGTVSNIDIIFMKRCILDIGTSTTPFESFPGNRLWAFINQQSTFADANNPFINAGTNSLPKYNSSFINLNNVTSCNPTGKDFYGVKLGDVNWNWDPSVARAKPVQLFFNSINATEQNVVTIPMRANNFNNLQAIQFSLSFDPSHFEFAGFENSMLEFDINSTQATVENNNGVISFVWLSPNSEAVTLADGSILFNLLLHKKRKVAVDDIVLTSDLTKVEVINNNLELVPLQKTKCQITDNGIGAVSIAKETWDLMPSYSTMGNVFIKLNVLAPKTVTIEVMDKEGTVIHQSQRTLVEGNNTIFTNINTTSSKKQGVYYVRVKEMKDQESKPFFLGEPDQYATPTDIATGNIDDVVSSNKELTLYALQTQLYFMVQTNSNLLPSTVQASFINQCSANIGSLFEIWMALANGNNTTAAMLLSSFVPANAIDSNYKNYYGWVLKTVNNETITTTEEDALNNLAIQCPLTAGMVVFDAQDISNCLTEEILLFGNVCPNSVNTTSRNQNKFSNAPAIVAPKAIARNKKAANSLVSIYPNPTKGAIKILIPSAEKGIWNIAIMDAVGKTLLQKTTSSNTQSIVMEVSKYTGIYFVVLTNTTTNKKIVEKVIVE
jgi:Secretion system C-terminal sorting domain